MNWLYRYEVKGIQRWILASDKLKELAGGSSVIEHLGKLAEQTAKRHDADLVVESLAAGGATFRFSTEAALRAFAADWPMQVDHMAPGLQLVQSWIDADVGDAMQHLAVGLAAARQRRVPSLPEACPWAARSGRTGLPAVATAGGVLVDAGTRARRSEDRKRLDERLLGDKPWGFDNDLDGWAVSDDRGVAVVHADGNAIGQRVMGLDDAERKAFSAALSEATLQASRVALDAFERRLPEHVVRASLPLRPVVIGGDDVTFLVPRSYAVPFAHAYLAAFDAECATRPILTGVTACAGVIIVRTGFPFSQAHALAEELCRSAKQGRTSTDAPSRLAFHRLTTSLTSSLDEHPSFSLEQLVWLEELTAAIQAFKARGKLRRWVELAGADGDAKRADDLWRRTADVARDTEARAWGRITDALAGLRTDALRAQTAMLAALEWSMLQPIQGSKLWRAVS